MRILHSWLLFLICALMTSPASAGLLEWKAPSEVKLPQAVSPLTGNGSAWRQEGKLWILDARRQGYLETPAWWTADRPPRGEMVVLEIEYKDDLLHPARAEVYSGLSTRNPYSEMHRFGGVGDGRWKTARVPLSSDFLFLYQPSKSVRIRLSPLQGRFVAREFRLVAPLPDEEQRYNTETRAWVEREQKRAVISPRYYKLAQTAVLPAQWVEKPLVPYQRNWMDLVRPISAPQAGEAGGPLTVRMFRNEYEPVQLGVYANGRDLNNVRVSVDPITDPSGRTVAEVKVRVAEYSKVNGQVIPGFLIQPFPQRLWPAYPFDVAAGRSHMVWLVLHTSEGEALPGRYTTRVRIQADATGEISLPLEVEIMNLRLLTMEEARLKLGGCTTGLLPEFELGFLHGYNHNMVNIWYAGVRPELSKSGDSFEMDFRIMDDWMAAAKRQKMSDMVYFLGGNPYGFPQTMNLPRSLAATVSGLDDAGWRNLALKNPNEAPPSIAPLIVEWNRRFGEHERAKGWPNVILTPFDEPAKWVQYRSGLGMLFFIKPQFKEQVRLLRKGNPNVQIYGSIHHYDSGIDFLEDVDIFCTNAVAENWSLPDEVRAAGKTLWEYSGTTDKGLPAVARYTFGYYFASHDSRGSLVWAYNWGNRFDTLDGSNWMYAWNTPFDVIPTPYMEGLREAWDDRRLLETLKRAAKGKGVDLTDFLGRLFAEVAMARGQGGRSTLDDFWERAKNDRVMDEWKQRIVEKLVSITSGSPAAQARTGAARRDK